MIKFSNVSKTYPPDQTALGTFDLKVSKGEFLFIAGASGAGKSTLMKLLYGAERPSTGTTEVDGQGIFSHGNRGIARLRRKIGIVFQDYKLLNSRTVIGNVMVPLKIEGLAQKHRREIASKMLEAVGILDKANVYPKTLSGGEQQRVALARALVNRPSLLLADEPTGNLDTRMTSVVFELFLQANRLGVTVIIASHNLTVIEELGFRTLVLERGRVIGDFPMSRSV